MTPQEEARALVADGASITEAAVLLGRSTSTVWQWVNDPTGEKNREHKRRYGGPCMDCGAPTCGNNGRTKAPKRCLSCHKAFERQQAVWTREAIIRAIGDWVAEHDDLPTATEWRRAEPGRHPTSWHVQCVFGSWNAAIKAAGHTPRRQGERRW